MKTTILFALILLLAGHVFAQEEEAPARAWTNKAGKTIVAKFVKADDETVTILFNGQPVVLQLSDLSDRSQLLAAELQEDAEPEPKPDEPTEEAPAEENPLEKEHDWKNIAGKIIKAKYVRSDETKVIILMRGREIPYALSKLSSESQELAANLRQLAEPGSSVPAAPIKPAKPEIDLTKEYQWTNSAGKTLNATFVSADSEKVILNMQGREYPLSLASLSKDSQDLAAKLKKAWEDAKPPEPKVIQGKGNRMAYYGNGDWKGYNTVFQSTNFDSAIHWNGVSMHVWFKDRGSGRGAADGQRIGSGKPITMNFNMHYYDRSDPKRVRHRHRKVVSIEKEWEVSDSAEKGIRVVKGMLDNNGTFEVGFDLNHKSLGIWGKVDDTKGEPWPTRVYVGIRVPKCINWTDEMRAKDWDPLLGDAAIHITPVEGPQARLPLNMKWLDLKKKFSHTNPAKGALVFGKPWGAFKLRVTPRTTKESSFRWGRGYTGVFPFQGFYFGYSMNGYEEITRAKRLDLIVYR